MEMLKFIKNINYGSSTSLLRSNLRFIPNYQMITLCSSTAPTSQLKIRSEVNKKPGSSEVTKDKLLNTSQVISQLFVENDKTDALKGTFKTFENIVSVEDLLKMFENKALKKSSIAFLAIVLERWVSEKKIIAANYEQDPRFQQILKIGAKMRNSRQPSVESNPSNFNEINQIIDTLNLTPSQCVKQLNGLAIQHKRTKPFIQHLLITINNNINSLTFKEIVDVFYAMALLNYPDEMLLKNMCTKVLEYIDKTTQSPIIGSIVVSLGKLRYRNEELMNKICDWMVHHKSIVRTRDARSLLLTLACLALRPSSFDDFIQELIKPLTITDMTTSLEWIDLVWALSVLDQATPQHLESVLNNQFIDSLSANENTSFSKKAKLQNINSIAKLLMSNYEGPFLNLKSPLFASVYSKNKEKQIFIRAITDALANLFPSRDFFDVDFIDDAGLEIDIVFYYDKRKGPLPMMQGALNENAIRFAVVANTFHDYCLGDKSLIGSMLLQYRLLQARGYQIMDISHEDFHPADTLLKRITHINDRIKAIVNKM